MASEGVRVIVGRSGRTETLVGEESGADSMGGRWLIGDAGTTFCPEVWALGEGITLTVGGSGAAVMGGFGRGRLVGLIMLLVGRLPVLAGAAGDDVGAMLTGAL